MPGDDVRQRRDILTIVGRQHTESARAEIARHAETGGKTEIGRL
jgi:hypothetical protein